MEGSGSEIGSAPVGVMEIRRWLVSSLLAKRRPRGLGLQRDNINSPTSCCQHLRPSITTENYLFCLLTTENFPETPFYGMNLANKHGEVCWDGRDQVLPSIAVPTTRTLTLPDLPRKDCPRSSEQTSLRICIELICQSFSRRSN